MLPLGLTPEALAAAADETDPGSLGAGSRLRARFGAELAAAAVDQVVLRRRAWAKFGDAADGLFLTRDGLEQATRPAVADHHAVRLAATGATTVLDLGCGIGADALAFVRAGLRVIAVERDPRTAEIARANLDGTGAEVLTGDAEEVVDGLLGRVDAVYLDPARRAGSGRLWRVEDFTPPWALTTRLLDGSRPAAVKLGPALPHRLVPDGVEAEWVTDHGETVEVGLYAGPGVTPGRAALVMPDHRLVPDPGARVAVRPLGAVLIEPVGSVIRAGAIPTLAAALDAGLVADDLAYLTADTVPDTPFATAFAVREVLPWKEKMLRGWVRERAVGRLEIKVRGLDVDPAQLRKRLRPSGPGEATLIITRTPDGARVVVADRLG
ncbi:SAM-dependent methyltransferase [Friedmanniella endophytica]|uniref:SAM-dependent methyltransferase n=1 Tax=Microlunatus kandeliicorticis TaxID=1759536 RepID=A0A7W3IQ60_9ACTN|nr:class I SAM-dependent methyltransferase [Microlunatus kandeliicorticis]MBA8793196.1 SAM-dependent methyltransferase [Microlunatus kandeliicorticis]